MSDHALAKQLFLDAIVRPQDDRPQFLTDACRGDADLRAMVEGLLAAHDSAGRFLGGDGTARPAASVPGVPAPSTRIGRYKLLECIGEGGFGEVWMAEQTEPVLRRVALKIIKSGMDTRQVIARFEAERQALAMMDHPNIARVLDAGATDAGRPFFVMELVSGDPVTRYCDREQLSVGERLELFRDICRAVQHAHQKGIIHRDIKPGNVLVTVADGRPLPKVIDFGIAKAIEGRLTDKTLFTEHRALIGTPAYMSPEQADMSSMDIDTRSDIYSLGVLLYELLAGSTPLESARLRTAPLDEIQRMIREEEPPRPSLRIAARHASSHIRLETPAAPAAEGEDASAVVIARRRQSEPSLLTRALRGDLDWIVMKCLEKDRRRRYGTASELADDVERYLDHQPVLAMPPSRAYRARKFLRRHRGAVLALTVAGGALVAAAGLSLTFGMREARQRGIAETAAADLEQVARFQEARLSDINPQTMGLRIREDVLERARAVAVREKLSDEAVEARVADLERLVAGSDFTGIAVDAVNENFLAPSLAAIEDRFADQPLIRARLLQSLATTCAQFGLGEAALDAQRKVVEIRRAALGNEHSDSLDSLTKLAYLLTEMRRVDEAEPACREALDRCRAVLGDDHPTTILAISTLGYLFHIRGMLPEAESHYREALDRSRAVLGEGAPDALRCLNNLAALLWAQGRIEEAEPLFIEALEQRRRVLGDDDPATLNSMNNVSMLLRTRGRLQEAESYARQTLEARTRVLGEDHPHTVQSVNNLGLILRTQGRLAEAEPYYREALEKRRRLLGEAHPDTLISVNNMGALLQAQGRLAESEPFLREAVAQRRISPGADHPDTLLGINNLGILLRSLDRLDEAEPIARESYEGHRRILGDEHPSTLYATASLGELLRAQGKPQEALDLLAPSEAAARKAFTGDMAVRLAQILATLGSSRAGVGEFPAAEAHLLEAQTIMEAAKGATPRERTDVMMRLVELYEAWHAAEPDAGHGEKAERWRGELAASEAAETASGSAGPTGGGS